MKTLITIIFAIILLNSISVAGQDKKLRKDTIYYLLDTAAVPVKDRMFTMEREGRMMVYGLACRCNPYGTSIPFFYDVNRKKGEIISKEKFSQIETVSITKLIDIALKCLNPSEEKKYVFIFVEPEGTNMKLTKMTLGAPHDPKKITDSITIKDDQ